MHNPAITKAIINGSGKLRFYAIVLLIFTQVKPYAQLPGMHVNGRYLYSAGGDTVILKGFNAMIVYWDIHGDKNFPEIEKTGANCVRIFWNLASPRPQPSDLDQVLGNCIAHHMIPVISLWEATGKWNKIQYCVDYWCSVEIVPILQKYEKYLLLNIANEPGDGAMADTVFSNTYASAVEQIRTAGLHMPLIIDADNWGRNADAVLDNGGYLLETDPDHNLIFSWHLWDPKNWGTGTQNEITRILDKAVEKNLCFIVGEFGPCEQCENCSGTQINWEFMIEKAYHNHIGYLPWVWKWSDCHSIVNNNTGSYGSWVNPPWGENVALMNAYSIKNTARRPSDLQTGVNILPNQMLLFSALPNPFAGEVIFRLRLNEPSRVSLMICDLYGRKIKTLISGQYYPGEQTLYWNSDEGDNSLQSGIYLYKLILENVLGSTIRTGKMIKL